MKLTKTKNLLNSILILLIFLFSACGGKSSSSTPAVEYKEKSLYVNGVEYSVNNSITVDGNDVMIDDTRALGGMLLTHHKEFEMEFLENYFLTYGLTFTGEYRRALFKLNTLSGSIETNADLLKQDPRIYNAFNLIGLQVVFETHISNEEAVSIIEEYTSVSIKDMTILRTISGTLTVPVGYELHWAKYFSQNEYVDNLSVNYYIYNEPVNRNKRRGQGKRGIPTSQKVLDSSQNLSF